MFVDEFGCFLSFLGVGGWVVIRGLSTREL